MTIVGIIFVATLLAPARGEGNDTFSVDLCATPEELLGSTINVLPNTTVIITCSVENTFVSWNSSQFPKPINVHQNDLMTGMALSGKIKFQFVTGVTEGQICATATATISNVDQSLDGLDLGCYSTTESFSTIVNVIDPPGMVVFETHQYCDGIVTNWTALPDEPCPITEYYVSISGIKKSVAPSQTSYVHFISDANCGNVLEISVYAMSLAGVGNITSKNISITCTGNTACPGPMSSLSQMSSVTRFSRLPSDATATSPPSASQDNTAIIVGTTVCVIFAVLLALAIIILVTILLVYRSKKSGKYVTYVYTKKEAGSELNKKENGKATKESLILEFEKTTDNCHEHPITHCVISPDAKYVVTADTGPVVKLWEPNDQNELLCEKVLNHEKIEEELTRSEKEMKAFSFKRQLLLSLDWLSSSDGDRQLCLAYDNCVVVWNTTQDKVSKIYEPERNFGILRGYSQASIICAACTYFGPTYAISFTKDIDEQSLQGFLILKKMTWPNDQQMKTLCEGGDFVVSMSISSEGKILVTGSITGLLQTYNIHYCDVECLQSVRCSGSIWEIQFCSADEKNMCCLVDGKQIYFWSRSTKKLPTKMVDSIACQSPLLPWLGGIAKHPVTKRNKLFGSFCANRYILVNSDGAEKVLYKVDYDSASKAISPLSDDPFGCLDCVTHGDTTTCVMAPAVPEEQGNHMLILFRLKYEGLTSFEDYLGISV